VAKSDPPDPASIAEHARALLRGGGLSTGAVINGLSAILQELRNGYRVSGKVLEPIEDLIQELRSHNQEPPRT
jgi:hypothetical protein